MLYVDLILADKDGRPTEFKRMPAYQVVVRDKYGNPMSVSQLYNEDEVGSTSLHITADNPQFKRVLLENAIPGSDLVVTPL